MYNIYFYKKNNSIELVQKCTYYFTKDVKIRLP